MRDEEGGAAVTVIYIDRVFALNLALDYMLLLISRAALRERRCGVCGFCCARRRGAFYAAAVFLPGARR